MPNIRDQSLLTIERDSGRRSGTCARSRSEPLLVLGGGIGQCSSGGGGLSEARGSLHYQTPASLLTPYNRLPVGTLPKRTPACRIDSDLGDAA